MGNLEKTDNAPAPAPQGTRKADSVIGTLKTVIGILSFTTILLVVAVCVLAAADDSSSSTTQLHPTLAVVLPGDGATTKPPAGTNICHGAKPDKGAGFDNWDCMVSGVVQAVEQSGANVTAGYQGLKPATQAPQLQTYFKAGMCP